MPPARADGRITPRDMMAIREALGLSQKALAPKLGIATARTVRAYEKGAWIPSAEVLERYRQLRDLHGGEGADRAAAMRAIRRGLGLSRAQMARELGLSAAAAEVVRAFEERERAPDGPVWRLYEAFRDGALAPRARRKREARAEGKGDGR